MRSNRQLLIAVTTTAVLQAVLWLLASQGRLASGFAIAATLATAWGLIAMLVFAASRHVERLSGQLQERQSQHQATLDQVEQLEALNEMLVTLGRTKDAGLAFQGLARRIGRLLRCDRLGLAVMHANGHDVETYISRVTEPERRRRPRVEQAYRLERSLFGQVIRSSEPFLVEDLASQAGDFVDAQALVSQGFQSAIVVPLMSRNRAIGTLMAISRSRGTFTAAHSHALQPMAEVLAFAFVAQQQHTALQHYRAMETLAEVSLSVSTDINSALQAIIGQCGVIGTLTPAVASDVDVIIGQADRIKTLLERVKTTAQERLRDAAAPIHSGAIPESPEEIASEETL
ncbi:MAG: GAF domain-containing protein [Acidobacteria bacterium]|nr:MAG: GAF domain-containing protein [Acidobacteriota bacterium]